MASRFIAVCVLLLSVFFSFSGSGAGTPYSDPGSVDNPQARLIEVLKARYPKLYYDIAVQGATPDDAAILFLLNKGGTYVLRRGAGQVPEIIHHAKIIAPGAITRITYQNRAFMLWSGNKLQLTLAGYP